MSRSDDITRILSEIDAGRVEAADALLPLVQDELRAMARARMRDGRSDHALQPTALVNEAWLRLFGAERVAESFPSRSHFLRAAAVAMRHILIDHARGRGAAGHARRSGRLLGGTERGAAAGARGARQARHR